MPHAIRMAVRTSFAAPLHRGYCFIRKDLNIRLRSKGMSGKPGICCDKRNGGESPGCELSGRGQKAACLPRRDAGDPAGWHG
jgi:hypothetical protein